MCEDKNVLYVIYADCLNILRLSPNCWLLVHKCLYQLFNHAN